MNRQNWKEEQKHIKQRENCRGLVTVFLLITKPTALTVARCSLQILLFQNIYLVQAALTSRTDRREQSDRSIETDPNRTHKWNHTKEEQLHKSEAQSQQINPPERSRALLNGAWYKLSSTHAAAGGVAGSSGLFSTWTGKVFIWNWSLSCCYVFNGTRARARPHAAVSK